MYPARYWWFSRWAIWAGNEQLAYGPSQISPASAGLGSAAAMKKLRIVTLGVSGGRSLTRPLRDARRFPSTFWYPVLGATRTTLGFGICPSFKGHFLSRRAKPHDSQLLRRCTPVPVITGSTTASIEGECVAGAHQHGLLRHSHREEGQQRPCARVLCRHLAVPPVLSLPELKAEGAIASVRPQPGRLHSNERVSIGGSPSSPRGGSTSV
jgi:hypothetical protein